MGILSRFKDIMSANINSVLEKAESKNADKILENYLRDAKENLEEVAAETAGVIADEMAAARKVADLEEEIGKLSRRCLQETMRTRKSSWRVKTARPRRKRMLSRFTRRQKSIPTACAR